MNIEAFRNEVAILDRMHIFSDKAYASLEWPEWYKLATMTKNIEYGCRFGWKSGNDSTDEQVKCAAQREHDYTGEKCCCSSCDTSLGYLKFIQNDQEVIKRIAGLFQPKIGFWRKDKGCALPRKYRSAVCLGFRCGTAARRKIHGVKGMLVLFMDSIRIRQLSDKNIRILGKALLKSK